MESIDTKFDGVCKRADSYGATWNWCMQRPWRGRGRCSRKFNSAMPSVQHQQPSRGIYQRSSFLTRRIPSRDFSDLNSSLRHHPIELADRRRNSLPQRQQHLGADLVMKNSGISTNMTSSTGDGGGGLALMGRPIKYKHPQRCVHYDPESINHHLNPYHYHNTIIYNNGEVSTPKKSVSSSVVVIPKLHLASSVQAPLEPQVPDSKQRQQKCLEGFLHCSCATQRSRDSQQHKSSDAVSYVSQSARLPLAKQRQLGPAIEQQVSLEKTRRQILDCLLTYRDKQREKFHVMASSSTPLPNRQTNRSGGGRVQPELQQRGQRQRQVEQQYVHHLDRKQIRMAPSSYSFRGGSSQPRSSSLRGEYNRKSAESRDATFMEELREDMRQSLLQENQEQDPAFLLIDTSTHNQEKLRWWREQIQQSGKKIGSGIGVGGLSSTVMLPTAPSSSRVLYSNSIAASGRGKRGSDKSGIGNNSGTTPLSASRRRSKQQQKRRNFGDKVAISPPFLDADELHHDDVTAWSMTGTPVPTSSSMSMLHHPRHSSGSSVATSTESITG